MMASDVEDTDLDALRSAVLASLKPRGNKDLQVERSSKNDAELEELRKAALRSKRFAENNSKTQPNANIQTNFQPIRGFRTDFPLKMGYYARPNLIVIQPVQNEETISNSSFTTNNKSKDESSNTTVSQRGKSSGKFSRFESDSESSEESEEELSDDALDDEKNSETGDEAEYDDEEQDAKETDDESVLLLHPDDELPDSECTLQISNFNVEITEDDSVGCKTSQLDSSVERRVRNDGLESRRSGKSSRHSERQSRTELGSIKENNDGRSRSERRLEVTSRNGERHRRRDNDDLRKERRKHTVTSDDRRIESRRAKNGKERHRVTSRNVDDLEMSNSQHRSKFCVVGDDKMPSIVVTSHCRRRERRSNSGEREEVDSLTRDSSRSSFGDSNVLRSRNSSPTAQPIDLREKLRLRKRHKEGKEGFEKDGHRGEERSSSVEDEDDDQRMKRSLTECDRTPIVRSVLSVVKISPASSDVKSRSRSPLSTRERRKKSSKAVRRKSDSPIESDRTSKSRKIIINDEKSACRVKRRLKSSQIDIIITDDVAERSGGDSSPVHRIPVRQRLGVPPNSSGASNFKGTSPSSVHRRSLSPHTVTERRSTSPSSTTSGQSREPKRKVKLRRDAFAASASADMKHELSSGKSRIHKGRPTFENELDEKIRRIQANNEAILKRKYEIAWDQHKHN